MARRHKVKPFKWGKFSKKGLRSIRDSTARLNIWEGAVRSSKTISSIVRWLEFIATAPSQGELFMIGKTERTLKRNILDVIESMVGEANFKHIQGAGEVFIYGVRIYIVGANDAKAEGKIRGSTMSGAYVDEITLLPMDFFKMLLTRLSVDGAKLFGTTNPDSPYHWLKTEYIDNEELNCNVFHFELDDNPNLSNDYIEALKKEFTGLWYKRFILGLWVIAEGAIYDMWDEEKYCVDILPDTYDRLIVGVDYGTTNPTVFLLVGQKGRDLYVIDEYYWDSKKTGRQKTDAEYSKDFQTFIEGRYPQIICIDPSAASFINQLKRDGVRGIRQADNSVLDGIRNVASFLSDNRLKVSRRCKNLIKEFTAYLWDPKAQEKGEDAPIKQFDHALDALRYVIQTLFSRQIAA